jgi:Amt family ammonium transporter
MTAALKWMSCLITISLLLGTATMALAQDEKKTDESAVAEPAQPQAPTTTPPVHFGDTAVDLTATTQGLTVAIDTVWVLATAFLVFFMNLGFATVESGFCRAKNCVNILSKNFIVFATTTIGFWLLGWGLMFGDGGDGPLGKFIGTKGVLMVGGDDNSPELWSADPAQNKYQGVYSSIGWTGIPLMAKFLFQLVFAGTAATIVSGCVAERIKYHSFILFSLIMSIAIYPVVGHWIWGGGWAALGGMFDFAGSTVVHSVGGWAGLAGILVLGPRIGKYAADGSVRPIPGHNLTAATIGCFVLWFGWFGFNPGSTMGATGGNLPLIGHIAVTTNSAAAAGTLTATITSWLFMKKPDLGMTLNGCLAGLVAITAPCAFVSVPHSLIIGAIAGVLVVFAVIGFDKVKIDDPVGALSVHLVNGVFGTICVGLFADTAVNPGAAGLGLKNGLLLGGGADQLMSQLKAVGGTAVYVFGIAVIAWTVLKLTVGIRVSREEELEGLDIGEHGNEAYSGFQMIREA